MADSRLTRPLVVEETATAFLIRPESGEPYAAAVEVGEALPRDLARAYADLFAAAPSLKVQLEGLLALTRGIISAANINQDRTTVVLHISGQPAGEVPIATLLVNARAALLLADGR